VNHQGATSTPFNTHHDLPLISNNSDLLQREKINELRVFSQLKKRVKMALAKISYDHAILKLYALEQRSNRLWLVDLTLEPQAKTSLPELENTTITLLLNSLSLSSLYFSLMDYFIALSDKHLDENFIYRSFARFSRDNNVIAISELSVATRQKNNKNNTFLTHFEKHNYETDKTRVPKLNSGALSEKIKQELIKFSPLEGILPL
jgi:hypothetical protein